MQIYDGSHDKKALPTKHTVSVISANRIASQKDWMTIRKNGREDWSAFYCESGRLHFDDQVLSAGEVWFYPPHVPQKYIGYRKDNPIYHYLHFTGSELAELLSSLNIPTHTPIAVDKELTLTTWSAIERAVTDDSALSRLIVEYNTLFLLSKIAPSNKQSNYTHALKRVTDQMKHDFPSKYNAARYAKMMNLSESRFNHLFKAEVGVAPYTYLLELRINNAATLLEQTNLQIKQIAEQSGFEDALYFTQAFKKAKGVTPSQYRKQSALFTR